MNKKWKIAEVNFDHMHMGDLLRQVFEHPAVLSACEKRTVQL